MKALDNIKAALEAGPTEGPWKLSGHNEVRTGRYRVCVPTAAAGLPIGEDVKRARINAAFIAACNPSAIRELLAYVESLEEFMEYYDHWDTFEEWKNCD